ncbi:MAG: endonuclease/exonuclease/phosphatase family protein [Candidatus Dormibacteraeota bacterium]|uniref:Endonuclease/exonuclease/phosphatase family protein n=1 Tax=Candidatus Amunia macphersoniae TaxID=3127014 RepID=A0A934NJK8_9BACT|nr:endonuclease/exonuclease/phosphatase family protein [Candidatus Dormibacteraeota bacterium]
MSRARVRRRPLRLVTYNILLGGARREDRITSVLARLDADVIALQEVSNPEFAAQLARHLGMELIVGAASDGTGINLAVLSRLPVSRWHNHTHRGRMLRSHLETVLLTGGSNIAELHLHSVHLAARFGERNKGEARRRRELDALLSDIDASPAHPHLIAGDFNSLAPGDGVEATAFFARMAELRRARVVVRKATGLVAARSAEEQSDVEAAWLRAGIDPRLDVGIPTLPFVVYPLTSLLPRSEAVDRLLGRRIERWTVSRLLDAEYTDCFRAMHPRAAGYTCATWMPAARIDYVFADPLMAGRLQRCEVVGGRRWPDREAAIASDHHPLVAEFSV